MQNIWQQLLLIMASLFMLFAATIHAGQKSNIYQEPAGRFTIVLPPGYSTNPKSNELEFQFTGQGPDIVLVYLPKQDNAIGAYQYMRQLLGQRIRGIARQGRLQKLKLNGSRVTMGKYKGFIWLERKISRPVLNARDEPYPITDREPPFELIKTKRYAIVGVVVLKEGVVGYISHYSANQKQVWEKRLLNSLYTIRDTQAAL